MNVSRSRWTSALAALLLCGCAGGSAHATAPPHPRAGPPAGARAARACTPGARLLCLTPRSGGHTVTLAVGSTLEVNLRSPGGSWSGLSLTGPRLLREIAAPRARTGAVEASFRAIAPGATALRALERPVCSPGRACPQFILLWQVRVRVRRA